MKKCGLAAVGVPVAAALPAFNFKRIANALTFFLTLADLLDVLERGDIHSEMLKELDPLQAKIAAVERRAGVDSERVRAMRTDFKSLHHHADDGAATVPRLCEDRLIGAGRPRLCVPRGCCSFDLPALHIWLHLPQPQHDARWTVG